MKNPEYKVLIVDDTPENIEILAETLTDYKRLIANSGERALSIVNSANKPDIILLDIMMPEMDGFEVCRRIKENPQTADIPVIFITAKNSIEDEILGLELGAVDFISKPISPPSVKARVRNHLEIKKMRQELLDQNKELIEASKLRDDVDGIMRHDLKGPLVGIMGFPQLMIRSENITDQQKKMLGMIENSARNMLNMINRSLDIFKMERGKYQFNPEKFNINKTIHKICDEYKSEFEQKKINLKVLINGKDSVIDDEYIISGEELLCYTMFQNLIKNALEANTNGGVIEIDITDENKDVVLKIKNSGEVPEKIRETFWEKFSTAGKRTGTGIGTYSIKLIAETHGGKVNLDSSEKGFTKINIYIPKE